MPPIETAAGSVRACGSVPAVLTMRLAQFKVGVTFASLALIWVLRRQKRAQIAAWWICLVLTLVTCRWLMVNSLLTSAV